jgi:signal transduction histidine kinase
MPSGGTLTITSEEVENKLEISFADTGEGMTEETLNKLWVPLFTTKARGMGFGLSICKRLVEAHGGSISAKSTIGKGTTLTLRIPIISEPLTENAEVVFDVESTQSVRAPQ